MIDVTGRLTVNPDPSNPKVAVLDINDEWDDPGTPHSRLHLPLTKLIGEEVYVLVIPKKEMFVPCKECGHESNDHFHFDLWEKYSDPNARFTDCTYFRWDRHCDCQEFLAS